MNSAGQRRAVWAGIAAAGMLAGAAPTRGQPELDLRLLPRVEVDVRPLAAPAAAPDEGPPLPGEGVAPPRAADPLRDRLRILQEIAASPEGAPASDLVPTGRMAAEARGMRGNYQSLEQLLNREDYVNARQAVRQWMRDSQVPELKRIYAALLADLDVKAAEKQREVGDRTAAILQKTSDALRAARLPEELDAIAQELQDFRQNEMQGGGMVNRNRQRVDAAIQFLARWQNLLDAESSGDTPSVMRLLREMTDPGYGGWQTAGQGLVPRPELLAKREQVEASLLEEFEADLVRLRRQATGARSLEDWRQMAGVVQDWQGRLSHVASGGLLRSRAMRLNQAMDLWTQVLHAQESGQLRAALGPLQQLEHTYADSSIWTDELLGQQRATLLRLLLEQREALAPILEAEVRGALEGAGSIDELRAVLARLTPLMQYSGSTPHYAVLQALGQDVHTLARMDAAMRNQQWGAFWSASASLSGAHPWKDQLLPLRDRMAREVLGASTQLGELPPPAAGESLGQWLERLATEAGQEGDWRRMYLLLDALRGYGYAYGQAPAWLHNEMEAANGMIAAEQLAAAGEVAAAAEAYRDVLRLAGQRVPTRQAAQALARLREAPAP